MKVGAPNAAGRSAASLLICAIGFVAACALLGCGRNIGDDCQLNTDCSANGDRTCDLSQPGGYCTIEGCDERSCPSDSACVRFFPAQFLQTRCDPACEQPDPKSTLPSTIMCSATGPSVPTPCQTSGYVSPCAVDQVCLPVPDMPDTTGMPALPGMCAPRSSERRLCVKLCGGNGDCRGGYTCRHGGDKGSLPLLTNSCGDISFCAPQN